MTSESGRPSDELLVLLEFSASDPAQSISGALADSLTVRPLELDLIGVAYGRETDIERRAAAVVGDIVAAYPRKVALAASCAASPMLAPVARQAAERGMQVTLVAAVDPSSVTEGHLRHSLGQVVASLGLTPADDAVSSLDLAGPPAETLTRIGKILRGWLEEFLGESGMDHADQELVRNDLLDRYLRWHSFLLAMLGAPAQDPGCRVDVFLTDPSTDLEAIFGQQTPLRRHRYPRDNGPALGRDDTREDLRTLLTSAVATA